MMAICWVFFIKAVNIGSISPKEGLIILGGSVFCAAIVFLILTKFTK